MSFLDLPTELLSQILGKLVTSFGRSHIHSVLLTCKQLYQLALPLSVFIFRNTADLSLGGGNCSESRNVQFLRYIVLTKPELAKHVKAVIIGSTCSGTDRSEPSEKQAALNTPEELVVFEERIQAALNEVTCNDDQNAERCRAWIADLRRGFSDAQLALILLACPNLKTFYFEQPGEACSLHFLLDMAHLLHNSHRHPRLTPLSRLEEVYYESRRSPPGDNMFWRHAKRLMMLPRLRIYEAIFANSGTIDGNLFVQIPPRSSTVREIILHQSRCSPKMLGGMLGACRGLEKFEFTRSWEGTGSISARDVLVAVSPHSSTMSHLRFILHDQRATFRQTHPHPSKILYMGTRLRQMTGLRTLEVEMESLTRMPECPSTEEGAPRLAECLPDNLVHLQIHNCTMAILDQAAELLNIIEKGDRFTRLRHIRFLFLDETTDYRQVNLVLNTPDIQMDIVYQQKLHRRYDMGLPMGNKHRKMRSTCSRIFGEDVRRQWLVLRGSVSHRDSQDPSKIIPWPIRWLDNESLEPDSWA